MYILFECYDSSGNYMISGVDMSDLEYPKLFKPNTILKDVAP